jgi:ABC-2 type transport system ATP-binding protein
MGQTNTIHVENISKLFGDFRAVDDLSFEVFAGEIFAMLGPNGAGKSTTIRMILDILKPDTGSIQVLGAPITNQAKDRIGYLPEERGLYRSVKVIDMMVYLGTLKGMSKNAAQERSMALLEQLELTDHANSKVSELSKGMQQKVQFAVTVLHNPDLIIVDEPFSGLDPVNTLVIKDLLLQMRDRGTAIVMSTHQMYQVEELADRLLMINRGKQALYGNVDDVRQKHALHAIVVEGTGEWARLPGVVKAENDSNSRDGFLLHLEETTSPDDVLEVIARSPDYHVDRFELAVPSLNDIFIMVVGESLNSNGHAQLESHEKGAGSD